MIFWKVLHLYCLLNFHVIVLLETITQSFDYRPKESSTREPALSLLMFQSYIIYLMGLQKAEVSNFLNFFQLYTFKFPISDD